MTNSPALSRDEMLEFLRAEFPQVFVEDKSIRIDYVGWGEARISLKTGQQHLRPGGTVSGPTMMTMADCCAYICVLSVIGKVALAVTTNLNINFLRKPPLSGLVCEAAPLKIGKSLFVVETRLYSADDADKKSVAHATLTYSIPPNQ